MSKYGVKCKKIYGSGEMFMDSKKVSVANFNLVFYEGESEKGLLEYFDKILMPALTKGYVKKNGDTTYLFMNTQVIEKFGEYILTGIIVKKTILEVKSDLTPEGKLIEVDERYPAAPYSTFIIYLKNHRMVYIENQKGSPSLKSFRSAMQYILNKYTKEQMLGMVKEEKEKYPVPVLSVVGIPARNKIEAVLKDVEKINKLTLRFYPLNGDLDLVGMMNGFSTDLRKLVDCKNGDIILKSPKNTKGVVELVEKSEGTVESILQVTFPGKRKATISNDTMSERMEINIHGDDLNEELESMITNTKDIESLKYVSEGNRSIYEENKSKIIPFVRK